MVFSSPTFLYAFLPITLLLYCASENRYYRNLVLLAASLIFYAWGEPKFVLLMLLATLVAYVGGLLIHRTETAGGQKQKRLVFLLTVILLVCNLLVFKYLNFFCDNLGLLLPGLKKVPPIPLPIGISFYTFQILSYVIDLYRGKVNVQRSFFDLLLYLCFFPQLIAGPIVRYETVEAEIAYRHETWQEQEAGMKRFILGLAKKVLLANSVAKAAVIIYGGDATVCGTSAYWLAALAYTLQIYFDFSGYSDMAIGLGRIFGFHFLENFDYPYVSCSITEFWRRWHISLSTWFRDYIYIPLGGNRVGRGRWICNILIVWGLTGFWHGAQWNFILWGFYYAALLLLEKLALGPVLSRAPKPLGWLYTFFFVNLGWVLFNLTDFPQLLSVVKTMFCYRRTDWLNLVMADSSIITACVFMIPALIFSFPVLRGLLQKQPASLPAQLAVNGLYFGLLILCLIFIVSSSFNPFIYFRF